MEKNRASCDISHTSFFDSGTNNDFHYSIHENSVLYKSKKMKKLLNRRVEIQSNPCGGCINPSPPSKSPSLLKKISNLFCCYIPIKKKPAMKKENLEKTADKKNPESPNTNNMNSGFSDENHIIIDAAPKEVSQMDLSDDCNLGSEINYFADSKKQSPISIPKIPKCKSGTGSMQSKCPFLKKSYLAAKVSNYPENEIFFWKSNEHFVIAKIKHNDFYTDDNNLNENDNVKAKVCNNLSFSLAPNDKKLAFKEHLSSLDTIKPRFKYSVINMAEEVKHENKENLTYDERFRNSRPKNPNFLKNQNVFEKKIKIDSESWEYTIPDKVSSYLAKRCQLHSAETVLDAYCGIGMNAINFHQEGFEVIAMDSRMIVSTKRKIPSVEYAHYNATLHGIHDGIHFIKGEFLDINLTKMMIDVVLINPVLKYCPEKKFSLLKNSSFDYQAVLKKALGMVESVVLCLPRYVEILEIVELFSTVCNENGDSEMNCIIEVEFQFINRELQQILVFYGPVAGIGRKEVVDFLMNTVNKDNKTCKLKQNNFIQSIFSRIGIKASAKYIVSAEATKQVNSETILQRFLDLVKLNRELSMEDLDDCRKETEIAEKKEILIKEEKYRDMTLREQCLMLNVNEQNNEKKKFQNVMSTSTSNMFEMSYENYLDLPRSKILKGQEQINETPTISFYSGKLMSSQNTFNCTSLRDKEKNETKEFHYEYSFQKSPIAAENPNQEKKINSDPKNQDFDFWGPTNYEMGFTNQLKGKKNEGGKFPDFKCKFFDIV